MKQPLILLGLLAIIATNYFVHASIYDDETPAPRHNNFHATDNTVTSTDVADNNNLYHDIDRTVHDYKSTFGLQTVKQVDLGAGKVHTGHFVSGPQHLKSSDFAAAVDQSGNAVSQFYENVGFSRVACVAEQAFTAGDGSPVSTHVVGYQVDGDHDCSPTGHGADRSSVYCANWGNVPQTLKFEQTAYCYDITVPEVINNLFCVPDHIKTGLPQYSRALKVKNGNLEGEEVKSFDWCTTADYSTVNPSDWSATKINLATTKKAGDANDVAMTPEMFQIEDYDILDQQCYTLVNTERLEFDEVVCTEANHEKNAGSEISYGDGSQNFDFLNGAFDPHKNLDHKQPSLNSVIDDVNPDNSEIVNSFRQLADTRYNNQEYCISSEEETLLVDLFGCADDRRVQCIGDGPPLYDDVWTPENSWDAEGVFQGNTDHSNDGKICDDSAGAPTQCFCAGRLDADKIETHSDYLEWDPTGVKNNFYGNTDSFTSETQHRCSYPEITIANALSAYLDKADKDITIACSQSIERFHAASQGYVDFVNPDKHDDGAANIYTVLRAAWKQAEFTLRSAKIQEQTLDRLRKYQDLVESHFADAEQGAPISEGDFVNDDGYLASDPNVVLSTSFKSFREAFDQHVKDYIQLSKHENDHLKADLVTIVHEVDKAKAFAEDLAATQISSSSALATVSVHFRKKLKLWMTIENTLEEQLKTAFSADEFDAEHAYANLATSQHPDQPTATVTAGKAGEIGEGEDYNGGADREDEKFTATTIEVGDHDESKVTTITMSNGEVISSTPCTVRNDCSDYDYTAPVGASSLHDRVAACECHSTDADKCADRSQLNTLKDTLETKQRELDDIQAEFPDGTDLSVRQEPHDPDPTHAVSLRQHYSDAATDLWRYVNSVLWQSCLPPVNTGIDISDFDLTTPTYDQVNGCSPSQFLGVIRVSTNPDTYEFQCVTNIYVNDRYEALCYGKRRDSNGNTHDYDFRVFQGHAVSDGNSGCKTWSVMDGNHYKVTDDLYDGGSKYGTVGVALHGSFARTSPSIPACPTAEQASQDNIVDFFDVNKPSVPSIKQCHQDSSGTYLDTLDRDNDPTSFAFGDEVCVTDVQGTGTNYPSGLLAASGCSDTETIDQAYCNSIGWTTVMAEHDETERTKKQTREDKRLIYHGGARWKSKNSEVIATETSISNLVANDIGFGLNGIGLGVCVLPATDVMEIDGSNPVPGNDKFDIVVDTESTLTNHDEDGADGAGSAPNPFDLVPPFDNTITNSSTIDGVVDEAKTQTACKVYYPDNDENGIGDYTQCDNWVRKCDGPPEVGSWAETCDYEGCAGQSPPREDKDKDGLCAGDEVGDDLDDNDKDSGAIQVCGLCEL